MSDTTGSGGGKKKKTLVNLNGTSFENLLLIHHERSIHGVQSCTAGAILVLMDFTVCHSWAVWLTKRFKSCRGPVLPLCPRAMHHWSNTYRLSLCIARTLMMDSPVTSITSQPHILKRESQTLCESLACMIVFLWHKTSLKASNQRYSITISHLL